jgi:Uma2 family endonuclease
VTVPARARMTADEFIPWAMAQPEGFRYELVAGQVIAMSPERASHNEGKLEVVVALRRAIRETGLPCRAYTDGMAVRVDADTVYEPDALVRCGERLGPDVALVVDPVILVEVISPSTHKVDTTQKLGDYFRVPSVRHYVIVNEPADGRASRAGRGRNDPDADRDGRHAGYAAAGTDAGGRGAVRGRSVTRNAAIDLFAGNEVT